MLLTNKATMEPDRAAKATQQTHSIFLIPTIMNVIRKCGINTLYDETEVYMKIYDHLGNLYYTIGVPSMNREGIYTGFQGDNKSLYKPLFHCTTYNYLYMYSMYMHRPQWLMSHIRKFLFLKLIKQPMFKPCTRAMWIYTVTFTLS